jgi:hypothetical protein
VNRAPVFRVQVTLEAESIVKREDGAASTRAAVEDGRSVLVDAVAVVGESIERSAGRSSIP